MENKQTAVDFLLHELSEIVGIVAPDAFSATLMKIKYDQAKAMEKEQIKEAFVSGSHFEYEFQNSENYYNETYKNNS